MTLIAGGARLGNCAMGRRRIEITPPSMMIIAMTHAKTGRSMKNLDIVYLLGGPKLVRRGGCGRRRSGRRLRRNLDRRTRADALQVVDDHLVTGFQAGRHEPLVP